MQLLRALRRCSVFLGWLVLILAALAFALEASGLARSYVEHLASVRLSPLGGTLHIGRLDIRWLERALVARDVRLDDGRELLVLERVRLDLRLARTGPSLERAQIWGGRLFLTPGLYNGVRGLLEDRPAAPREPSAPSLFELFVTDFEVAVEAVGQRLAVGKLDVALARDPGAGLVLQGILRQPPVAGSTREHAVHLYGSERRPGVLELGASAPGLLLTPELLPASGAPGAVRDLEPRGRLRLAAEGVLDLARGHASGRLRLSLDQGSLLPPTSADAVRDVTLDLDARYEPQPGQDPWEPRAWRATARGSCRWRDAEASAGGLLGRAANPGLVFEVWARAPRLAFDEELIELSGRHGILLDIQEALAPLDAAADVRVGLRLRDGLAPGAPLARGLDVILDAEVARGTRLSYQSWPSHSPKPEPSFPLPAEVRRGRVVFAHGGRHLRPELLVIEGSVQHPTGTGRVVYQGWSPPRDMPPFAPGFGRPESDLLISSPSLAVDEQLRQAVAGLGADPALAGIWERYEPGAGRLSFALRLALRAELPAPALDLWMDLDGVAARLEELPVPVSDLAGRVHVRGDGRGATAASFALAGRTADAPNLRVAGRSRRSRTREGAERRVLDVLAVEVRGLQAQGRDVELLGELLPEVAGVRSALNPRGLLDLDVRRQRELEQAPERTTVELWADALELAPEGSPLAAEAVRGRALIRIDELGPSGGIVGVDGDDGITRVAREVETLVPALAGRTACGALLAWRGALAAGGPGRGVLLCAGLELAAAVRLAAGPEPAEAAATFSADAERFPQLEGRIDLLAEVDLEALSDSGARVRAHLRDNLVAATEDLRIEELRGVVLLEGGVLRSSSLLARLARTELEFTDAILRRGADGAPELEMDLTARAVPLDAEHLALFLDPQTVRSIVEDLHGRGVIDIEHGHLRLGDLGAGQRGIAFQGDLLLSDVTATVGVPLSIRSAAARVERLVLDEGGLRAHGRLTDLYGRVAGFELGPASLTISSVGTRLTLEDLGGTFERGWMRTLGRDQDARRSPALAIDLLPPYPFQLGLEFTGIDVKRILRGVFPTNLADRGDLDGRVRLAGSLDRLLDMRGAGSVELRRTRLWSIPVFRELFSQLGFDRTVLFDQLSGSFRLENGRIQLEDLEARSPLLKLVGEGWVDLDGAIRSDLEVRYSLVDKIPTLRRLVYLVQNTLLQVAIRGDLERPRVVLRGELTRLFSRVGSGERRLPIPELSSLPERF